MYIPEQEYIVILEVVPLATKDSVFKYQRKGAEYNSKDNMTLYVKKSVKPSLLGLMKLINGSVVGDISTAI